MTILPKCVGKVRSESTRVLKKRRKRYTYMLVGWLVKSFSKINNTKFPKHIKITSSLELELLEFLVIMHQILRSSFFLGKINFSPFFPPLKIRVWNIYAKRTRNAKYTELSNTGTRTALRAARGATPRSKDCGVRARLESLHHGVEAMSSIAARCT